MKKLLYYFNIIVILLLNSCGNETNKVLAQDNIWEDGVDKVYVGIENVIDFTSDGLYFYLLTDKEIIKVDGYGKTISSENHENVTGICYDPETKGLHRILKNCAIVTAKGDTKQIDLQVFIDQGAEKPEVEFLAVSSNTFFTCFRPDGLGGHSYSACMIYFNDSLKAERFSYLSGTRSGIFCKTDTLYYLLNSQVAYDSNKNPYSHGYLQMYDTKNGLPLNITTNDDRLTILSPLGIYSDKNSNYFTYSIYDKNIYKFKEN